MVACQYFRQTMRQEENGDDLRDNGGRSGGDLKHLVEQDRAADHDDQRNQGNDDIGHLIVGTLLRGLVEVDLGSDLKAVAPLALMADKASQIKKHSTSATATPTMDMTGS